MLTVTPAWAARHTTQPWLRHPVRTRSSRKPEPCAATTATPTDDPADAISQTEVRTYRLD
eukprot:6336653-Prymnesium_polylepis.1